MKLTYGYFAAAIMLTFGLGACIPRAPEPVASPVTLPAPAPPLPQQQKPTAQPAPENWADAPQTPGDWTYRNEGSGSIALFGDTPGKADFSIRCDRARGAITLMRASSINAPTTMTIRTETADRSFSAQPIAGNQQYLAVTLQARDPILDAMTLTRGRFAVETVRGSALYLPAWAEVTRVIEDCR